jgi:hypothetical protein
VSEALIISAGMPRAGSGWYYNLIHDLVVASGGKDARSVRKQYRLQRFLTEINCNISTLKPNRLLPVMVPALMGNRYAVKTHAGPSKLARWLQQRDAVTVIYIFRDPRAAMLSAYEYGRRALEKGRSNAFSQLTSLDSAAEFIQFYVEIWQAWSEIEGILLVRYEDLVNDYDAEAERLTEYLGIKAINGEVREIVEKFRPEYGAAERKGTHFYKGQIARFREVFSPAEIEKYSSLFEPALGRMGFSQ